MMSLALLFHYLMLNMFRMLVHPSSGACDLFVELFHGLYCSGSMCVGVTLWFGCGGVVSVCRLKPAYGYIYIYIYGPGSSVGIAIDYGLDPDRIPVGTRFSTHPDRPWGPSYPPVKWVPGLFRR